MLARVLAACALLLAAALPAVAQRQQPFFGSDSVRFSSGVANGFRWGEHVFASGSFSATSTYLVPGSTTGVWAMDVRTGTPLSTTPFHKVVGPDSSGVTASLGTSDDGLIAYRRNGLVRLAADGRVVDRWELPTDYGVRGLRLHGDTLFLYGGFTRVGGLERRGVAAVRMGSREVLGFSAPLYASFRERAVIEQIRVVGDRVFVFGSTLAVVGDSLREGVAALRRSDGALLPWKLQDPSRLSLLHRLGAIACLNSDYKTCYRYSYATGVRGDVVQNASSPLGAFGDGWIKSERGWLSVLYIYASSGLLLRSYGGGDYIDFVIYRDGFNGYGVLAFYETRPSGYARTKLYFVSEQNPDTTGKRFAYFGGRPEQVSVLGHQFYASTQPEYVVPEYRTVSHGTSLLPLTVSTGHPVPAHPLRVCGEVRSVAEAPGAKLYLAGRFTLARTGDACTGPAYSIVRLDATTGAHDASFAPVLSEPSSTTPLLLTQVRPTSRGLLVASTEYQYQPDVLRPRPGALGLYSSTGQLLDPALRVLGSVTAMVSHVEVVGDSLAVIAGSFTGAGDAPRSNFAVLRLSDGTPTAALGPAGTYTGMVTYGADAYASVTSPWSTAAWWRIPVSGGAAVEVCPQVTKTGPLVGRTGGVLLMGGTGLKALDPATCAVTTFTRPDGSLFTSTVNSVWVDGATIWAFGQRVYKFTNPVTTASEEASEVTSAAGSVRVWPRPARGTATVEATVGVGERRVVEAVDVVGRRVWWGTLEAGQTQARLDVSGWPSGWYGVVVVGAGGAVLGRAALVR